MSIITENSFSTTKKDESSKIKDEKEKDDKKKTPHEILPIAYPNVGYGNTSLPQQQNMLFTNATVWTCEDAGILKNTDVLVKDGKIVATWEHVLKYDGAEWKASSADEEKEALVMEISLTDGKLVGY